jgi:hypothetical protein
MGRWILIWYLPSHPIQTFNEAQVTIKLWLLGKGHEVHLCKLASLHIQIKLFQPNHFFSSQRAASKRHWDESIWWLVLASNFTPIIFWLQICMNILWEAGHCMIQTCWLKDDLTSVEEALAAQIELATDSAWTVWLCFDGYSLALWVLLLDAIPPNAPSHEWHVKHDSDAAAATNLDHHGE